MAKACTPMDGRYAPTEGEHNPFNLFLETLLPGPVAEEVMYRA